MHHILDLFHFLVSFAPKNPQRNSICRYIESRPDISVRLPEHPSASPGHNTKGSPPPGCTPSERQEAWGLVTSWF
jgi:hypothetical protein